MTEAGQWASEADKYDNQYGAYSNPYGTSYMDEGGKLTKKELKKVKNLGRKGDTELAHVNPQEKLMLKAMGGSGRTNPLTGLREYDRGHTPKGHDHIPHEEGDPITHIVGAPRPSLTTPFDPYADTPTGTPMTQSEFDAYDYPSSSVNFWDDAILPMWDSMWGIGEYADDYGEPEQITIPRRDRKTISPLARREDTRGHKVVNPFGGVNIGDDTSSSAGFLEGYRWDLENPYIRENVDIFDKGGKLTKKEMKKVQDLGRRGDTELAHVNPQEKAMLKSMGGSGGINPLTGLREYDYDWSWGGVNSHNLGHASEPFEDAGEWLDENVWEPTGEFGQNVYDELIPSGRPGLSMWEGIVPFWMNFGDPESYRGDFFENYNEDLNKAGHTGEINFMGTSTDPADAPPREPVTQPRIDRGTRDIRRSGVSSKDKSRISNPFQIGEDSGKKTTTSGLEGYRWDLENPYIRENVDIFDDGGVVSETESLPMDSILNRQLFTESSFNPSAESPKGALGLSQITKDTFNDMIGWGWVPEDLRTGHMTARELMQVLGTDIGRKMFDNNIWVNATLNKIKKESPKIAIIDDLRFCSEADAVLGDGGLVVLLSRNKNSSDIHGSEKDLENFDTDADGVIFIDNMCSIGDKNEECLSFLIETLTNEVSNDFSKQV